MISFILLFFLGFNLMFFFITWQQIQRIRFAEHVLDRLRYMYQSGMISKVQARVFMNDMTDPNDIVAFKQVYEQLREIHEKHQSSNR